MRTSKSWSQTPVFQGCVCRTTWALRMFDAEDEVRLSTYAVVAALEIPCSGSTHEFEEWESPSLLREPGYFLRRNIAATGSDIVSKIVRLATE